MKKLATVWPPFLWRISRERSRAKRQFGAANVQNSVRQLDTRGRPFKSRAATLSETEKAQNELGGAAYELFVPSSKMSKYILPLMPSLLVRLIVVFASISSVFGQRIQIEARPYMGLSGFVHTVRDESYNCSADPAEKPWRVSEVTYDRRGKEVYRAYFNPDGSVGKEVSTIFDSDGNETGWTAFSGKNEQPPNGARWRGVVTLSEGKPTLAVGYKDDVPVSKTTREYDKTGNKVREVTLELACAECTTTRTFKYDGQNRLIETTYDFYHLNSVQRRSYDAEGNVASEKTYDHGVLAWTTTRIFQGKRLLKEVTASKDGNTRSTVNTYNKDGNLTLTTIEDASITSRTTFEYDDTGRMRLKDETTLAKADGPPQDSEAEPTPGRRLEKYDVKGNQIERYIYDAKGDLYLTQLSTYDDQGRQTRLAETSRLGAMYSRDIMYKYDSHGNTVASFCRKVSPTGGLILLPESKKIITYYDN